MGDDDPTSFTQAAYQYERGLHEADFERFLTSRTPVDVRRAEAKTTVQRLEQIAERLRAQGVL